MSGKILNRETVLALLQAALAAGEHRFARQIALAWLAAFPGDLEITLLQAESLVAGGRPGQVITALEQVLRKDPFYLDAYHLLARACQPSDPARYAATQGAIYVLTGRKPEGAPLAAWCRPLRRAYESLGAARDEATPQAKAAALSGAEPHLQEAFHYQPELLLGAALHLLVQRDTQDALAVDHLARLYHSRWPECLPVNLVLAEVRLELGDEPEAVHLLHQCAAADAAGQVARRLWGENHPYRSLWPEDMVIYFDQPIPAGAAARLGWNILAPGDPLPPAPPAVDPAPPILWPEVDAPEEEAPAPAAPARAAGLPSSGDFQLQRETPDQPAPAPETAEPPAAPMAVPPAPPSSADELAEQAPADPAPEENPQDKKSRRRKNAAGSSTGSPPGSPSAAAAASSTGAAAATRAVQKELEQLARQLKQPGLAKADGRYPVYVIFSCKSGLNAQYGPQTTGVLDAELRRLAQLVGQRPGWHAMCYYPDDPASTAALDLEPLAGRDPWKLKIALADLDAALAKRGQRIGALLIVGGDGVVPFHRLPNPTDDDDGEVPSDSPYASLDANYFVPEWPVGRLPGEIGPDPTLLLEQIRQAQRYHTQRVRSRIILGFDLLALFRRWLKRLSPDRHIPNFGLTAAVWRRSSLAVFRPIGAPHTVLASPPEQSGSFDPSRILSAGLGYYNLHGLPDSPAWYGQRDPQEAPAKDGSTNDYPVALSPGDLRRNGHSPRVVFSEACYGGHILGKCEHESLALRFLSMGTLVVVGSTCISYGSINTPLIAADLLGHLFWQHMKAGYPAGEALLRAKFDLVREMERRQGYLDGEDQKTLISFVLYGDPLASEDSPRVHAKRSLRPKEHPMVKTVCDLPDPAAETPRLSAEAMRQVKAIVAEYLPGADLSALHLARQHAACDGHGHHCPTSDLPAPKTPRASAKSANGRLVVTISKQVKVAQHTHHHYMRVTLDEGGKPVKLSISR